MDNSINFARRFAHLVWLLINEPANIEEQKVTLRALAAQAKLGAYHLGLHGAELAVNDMVVPPAFTGVSELRTQMDGHGIVLVSSDGDATPADLLAAARVLASQATEGDNGAAADAQRIAAGIRTVHFAAKPRGSAESGGGEPARASAAPSSMDLDFGEVYDDPLAEAKARATPRNTVSIQTPSQSHDVGGLFAQFAASQSPTASYGELLNVLNTSSDLGLIDKALEGLMMLAERAVSEGRPGDVAEIMSGLIKREQNAEHETKRALGMALRRLIKFTILRAVATQMANVPERRDDYVAVFARAGEDGADALIELIGDPAQQRNRRLYFDLLVELKAGVPALLHMLTDTRWFAIRNAAELLGEMQVREAEHPLSELMLHTDERVRRAANGALMRLGTQRAMQTILAALANNDPELRIEAATALGMRKDGQAVPTLLKALEKEPLEDVQSVILLALGRHATPDALKRLLAAAAPERIPFKRKSVAFRVAAVHALAEARTPDALETLRDLQGDKDREVANAATFGLRRISRGDSKVTEL